ncbi:FtsX-like permease family protein [Nonomuraea turkmeniaca]|uniref:FtsX-like permease family protein n=1 Tax=Nonomuraea turkmeniaca TaxID=103838 RepID=A0A5S4F095_9ACTN|nr:ABC transporter permease [Nonomuraea turkmeniaca]TMR09463.1 FtsX-like permease family protein [Nonomuraea turkmeniaca]
MGRILLICRLAVRDLRRRPAEAALLLVAMTSATATLTLALALQGVTGQPYQSTREATAGTDVVASVAAPPSGGQPADLAALKALARAPGVAGHSGPFPYTQAPLEVNGITASAWAQGRDTAAATVDQPKLTEGSWVRDGGVVVEAAFAQALGVGAGDRITLDGRSFEVAGVAVTASVPPYPKVCFAPCRFGAASEAAENTSQPGPEGGPEGGPESGPESGPEGGPESGPPPGARERVALGPGGLIWLTEADVRGLVPTARSLAYVMNMKMADPAAAPAFVSARWSREFATPALASWQDILYGHARVAEWKQTTMMLASWLLGLLALASIAVLVGGRMADQLHRVGLLKAVGGTPGLVAAVLLAEHLAVALLATVTGLVAGRLAAPLLTDPGAGLLGRADAVPLTLNAIALVTAAALGIAAVATFVPAIRAARTSTVRALADAPRPPRRTAWLIAISARLPVPLLLGLRLAARRPRRAALGLAAVAVSVTGIVAALSTEAHRYAEKAPGDDPRTALSQALSLMVILLVAQAAVNAICISWATALDATRSSALARALGATPAQVSAGLAAAQVLPALAGALLGIAGGIGLAEIFDDDPVTVPPLWQLLAVVLGCAVAVTALTALPARISARRPAGEILQTELT